MKVDVTFPFDAELDARATAAAAEAAGYACAWNGEVKHDPFLALALAATSTSTMQLGTSIALAFARNPMSSRADLAAGCPDAHAGNPTSPVDSRDVATARPTE